MCVCMYVYYDRVMSSKARSAAAKRYALPLSARLLADHSDPLHDLHRSHGLNHQIPVVPHERRRSHAFNFNQRFRGIGF